MSEIRIGKGKENKEVFFSGKASLNQMPENYIAFLTAIKNQINDSRTRAIFKANAELILLYWNIGNKILEKQESEGWGAKVIDRLSYDLKELFPDLKGFSPRNLKYMRAFALAWQNEEIVQRTIAQIPWRSILAIIDKVKNKKQRTWYAQKTLEFGWSQPVLVMQIETNLYGRSGKTENNFPATLPPPNSELANSIFKDPYIFDFLEQTKIKTERELEEALIQHVERFLLELGEGFAFVGRQVHLELGENDFFIDLLFYHLKLRRYIVIELKAGKLEPGHVSQLNMYLNVVDDVLKHPDDKQTIGLLLVKQKDKVIAEYCLRGYQNPIGIANWEQKITKSLPDELKTDLPSIEDIEKELSSFKDR